MGEQPDGVTAGLHYKQFRYRRTRINLLAIDLARRSVRPVMGAQSFPFKMCTPILEAVAEGAVASVGAGFNMQVSHGTGVSDQPLHALVVDGEIWTTGIGGGGHGFLIGDGFATTRHNRIQVHLWRPDRSVIEVDHVNRGHDGTVAFTKRGGTNERPVAGRHYASLVETMVHRTEGDAERRTMIVIKVSDDHPLEVWPKTIVIESEVSLGLTVGDEVDWVQRLGGLGIRHIVSGWPELVHGGVNLVGDLDLQGVESAGPDAWFTKKGPRMVLGASSDGQTAYMLAVEGRLPSTTGLRLKELGTMLLEHDIAYATNMDGGGSVFMYLDGELVAPGVYNTPKTLMGLRPDHFATAVF